MLTEHTSASTILHGNSVHRFHSLRLSVPEQNASKSVLQLSTCGTKIRCTWQKIPVLPI